MCVCVVCGVCVSECMRACIFMHVCVCISILSCTGAHECMNSYAHIHKYFVKRHLPTHALMQAHPDSEAIP